MAEILIGQDCLHLHNDHISYIIGIEPDGALTHRYFGARIRGMQRQTMLRHFRLWEDSTRSHSGIDMNRLPYEFPVYGLGDMKEGVLSVFQEDGTAACDLRFVSAEALAEKPGLDGLPSSLGQRSATMRVLLRDPVSAVEAVLLYTIFDDCDVIARSVCIRNCGAETVVLTRAYSASLQLPDADLELLTLSGDWAREREWTRRPLVFGEQSVSSRHGASGHQASPFLAAMRPGTTEAAGEVWGMALCYSGNFKAVAQVDSYRAVRLMMGIHDTDFRWTLEPGESFQTPECELVWSGSGLDGMSAQYHRFCREHIVRGPWAHRPRPILLNNWEATYFDFNQEKLLHLAKTGADLGIELFVLDDGWFGKRNTDTCSLGDWTVNREKLPDGLEGLALKIHSFGMKFGLWVEPEMISPDSDLYRAHPDWCIHMNGRERIESRNQLVLDLSRPEVCAYVEEAISSLLASGSIDYIKWDMNRNFTTIGSDALPPQRQAELPHRYMLGLYGILSHLTERYPEVLFESCAGGGGRFDLGMLCYMPQTWCSDNTDAVSRSRIQYSTSLVFPPFTMGAHVSAVPNHQTARVTPLASRIHIAMSGCFGYELDLNQLPDAERSAIREANQYVKSARDTLFGGSFHRLQSPWDGDGAWIIVSEDRREAVAVYIRPLAAANECMPILHLAGLDPDADYTIAETGETYGGDELMKAGVCLALPDGDAATVRLTLRDAAAEG